METYQIKKDREGKYQVISPKGKVYEVTGEDLSFKGGHGLKCSCPGFTYRGSCKHLSMVPTNSRFSRLFVREVVDELSWAFIDASYWEVVGSYRRQKADVGDIDVLILISEEGFEQVKNDIKKYAKEKITEIMSGSAIYRFMYKGIQVDLTRVPDESVWSFYLLYRTGSKENNIAMRGRAKSLGLRLSEKGLLFEDGSDTGARTEQEVYVRLGMKYLEPWER